MDKQSNKSKLVLKALFKDFYNTNANRVKVANIINRKCIYSRRTLEWFCSNYSKRNQIVYELTDGTVFDVYKSYKLKLGSYQKKQFDPFKREREGYTPFPLKYTEDGQTLEVETTVGQLNFFKWCIEKEIIDYIEKNIKDIKNDMKNFHKSTTKDIVKVKSEKKSVKKPVKRVIATRTIVKKFDGVSLKFR